MIRGLCIDATGKPVLFPAAYWVKPDTEYTITWIFFDPLNNTLGVELKELPPDEKMQPYQGFKIERFVFARKDLQAIIELFKTCNEAADINIEELLEEKEVLTTN